MTGNRSEPTSRSARRAGIVACIAAALTAIAPSRASAEEPHGPMAEALRREGIHWPGEAGRRIQVSLGVYLIDFARISLREESFDMAGYLDVSWTDPTIALKPEERAGKVRRYRPGQIWAPALEFVNAVEQVVSEREGDLYVSDDGKVTQRVRFSHKFQSPLRLRRFPFDAQELTIVIAPFDPFADDLDLIIDESRVGKMEDASVTDWDIRGVGAKVVASSLGTNGAKVLYTVTLQRRSTFYLWRVLLPMTLLVVASWLVFWFDVANLQPQISTGLAILLSLVTFTYAIDFSLPKVAYLTFIDRYTLAAFLFVLAAIFAVSAMHVVCKRQGEEKAARIQAMLRPIFPACFAVAVGAIVALSFG